jgi:hypothetical protein
MRKEERESLSDLNPEPLVPSLKLADLPSSDRRATYTLQRSDSYKQAIALAKENRISVLFGSNSDFQKKDYDKEKYKTLPSQMGTVRLTSRSTSGQRRRPSSSHLLDRQESGIIPSPDTDEDQKSSGSARKKKSRIQKIKERVLHGFQKQTITEEERRQKKREKQGKQKKVQMRKKKVKSSSLEVIHEHYSETVVPRSRLKRIFSFRKSHKVYDGKSLILYLLLGNDSNINLQWLKFLDQKINRNFFLNVYIHCRNVAFCVLSTINHSLIIL